MPITPQQKILLDFLGDGKWHCMTNSLYMKDDRKRISELNAMGFEIIGMKCDKHCGVSHSSRVYMRKLKGCPEWYRPQKAELEIVGMWEEKDPWTGQTTGVYHEIYA